MVKKFYIVVWLLLAGSVTYALVNGPVTTLQMVVSSLIGLALIYGLAFWSVYVDTGEEQTT